MLKKLFSWFLRNLIYKEKEFDIAPDEDVLLQGAATLETKFLLVDGILMLTSKRLAHRSLGTGLRPSWLGGKRAAVDIRVRDIAGVTSGKKRVSPIDPVRSKSLMVYVGERDEPYSFLTPDSEIWQQRIDELKSARGESQPHK